MVSKTLFLKGISSISSLQNIKGIFQLCIFLLTAGIKIPGKWSIGKCHRPLSSLLPVDVNLWTEFPFEPSKEQSVSDRAPVDFIRGFRNRIRKFFWWNPESLALKSWIQLKESRILQRLESRIQVPSSRIRNPQRWTQNPRLSWTTLYSSCSTQ